MEQKKSNTARIWVVLCLVFVITLSTHDILNQFWPPDLVPHPHLPPPRPRPEPCTLYIGPHPYPTNYMV